VKPRLYGDLARLWPAVSGVDEYADEAVPLLAAFDEHLAPGRRTLLDLGVGGGHHLHHLLSRFEPTAVDRSPEMLALLQERHPEIEQHVGDMRTLRLARTFDAVLIHDAIVYMRSGDELRAAFDTAAAHLAPGGVLVTAPDWLRETFRDPDVTISQAAHAGVEVTYFQLDWDPDPDDTTMQIEMTFLVRESGRVRLERDRHFAGLFPRATWLEQLDAAGFDARERPFVEGHTLFVGVRR
jgi:SAM-dependent methyltransferase